MKNSLFFALLFIAAPVCFGQNKVVINADQGSVKISKHIYGHFAEHLGNCIYGGFYVGDENTEIPNTNGIRNDIVDAHKKLKIPNLRWPGGCFADTYHWKDGIGPKKSRPTIVNRWWGGVTEDNSFGTHDFLNLWTTLACTKSSGPIQLQPRVSVISSDSLPKRIYAARTREGTQVLRKQLL